MHIIFVVATLTELWPSREDSCHRFGLHSGASGRSVLYFPPCTTTHIFHRNNNTTSFISDCASCSGKGVTDRTADTPG